MPKGVRVPLDIKMSVLDDYYAGVKSVDRICAEYGIQRRRVYDWAHKFGHGARGKFSAKDPRLPLRVNCDEAEAVLLMISECEKIFNGNYLVAIRQLENRVLDIADELYLLHTTAHN